MLGGAQLRPLKFSLAVKAGTGRWVWGAPGGDRLAKRGRAVGHPANMGRWPITVIGIGTRRPCCAGS